MALFLLCLSPYPAAADGGLYTPGVDVYINPTEYCVIGSERNTDLSKWTFRHQLEIPEAKLIATGVLGGVVSGVIFVYYYHPDAPDAIWFSSGEVPTGTGYNPATWYAKAEHGPVAYYMGALRPVMPVNVVSKPLDVSSLAGGRVVFGYGLLQTSDSTVADAYQEMRDNHREITIPLENAADDAALNGGEYVEYCFRVIGVVRTLACSGTDCLSYATTTKMRQ